MKEFEITLEYPSWELTYPPPAGTFESMIFRTSPGGSHGIVPQEGTLIKLLGNSQSLKQEKPSDLPRLIPSLKLTASSYLKINGWKMSFPF